LPGQKRSRHNIADCESGRASLQGRESEQEAEGASAPAVANGEPQRTDDRVTVADVGSGAGFPGIPIKLWAPGVSLTLIESNQKKATFLKEVTRALTLTDVNVQTNRAESLTDASFDVVTLRAVERFESILPVAARLVAPGGGLALLIGQTQLGSAQAALPALNWSHPIPVPTSKSRVLVTARKP
jgi:16S rRNA (guanine527-N7)-methyltransferase